MESPSSRPYPYRSKRLPEASVYEFATDNGLIYNITFTTYDFPNPILSQHGVVLGIELPDSGTRDPGTDPRIEATVIAVIELLLNTDPTRVILWVCSPDKRQQAARNRKFDRWHRNYRENSGLLTIIKADLEVSPGEYTSLLYRADHPDAAALEALLREPLDK